MTSDAYKRGRASVALLESTYPIASAHSQQVARGQHVESEVEHRHLATLHINGNRSLKTNSEQNDQHTDKSKNKTTQK